MERTTHIERTTHLARAAHMTHTTPMTRMKHTTRMGTKGFIAATVILILAAAFAIGGTVMSRERKTEERHNGSYAALEEVYLDDMRQALEDGGFHDCGINIRWVCNTDGSREYTVQLHHRKFARMSDEEIADVEAVLSGTEFEDEMCSFRYVVG